MLKILNMIGLYNLTSGTSNIYLNKNIVENGCESSLLVELGSLEKIREKISIIIFIPFLSVLLV